MFFFLQKYIIPIFFIGFNKFLDWLRRIFGEEKTLFDSPRQKTKAEGLCYMYPSGQVHLAPLKPSFDLCKRRKGWKKQRTEEEMGRVLSAFDGSGQSVREFCAASGMAERMLRH
jgi:hypothetical protein